MTKSGLNYNRSSFNLPPYKRGLSPDIKMSIIRCKDLLRLMEQKEQELLTPLTKSTA